MKPLTLIFSAWPLTLLYVLLALAFLAMLPGCGAAVSITYTPPITIGLTVDMRPLYPPPASQPSIPATQGSRP